MSRRSRRLQKREDSSDSPPIKRKIRRKPPSRKQRKEKPKNVPKRKLSKQQPIVVVKKLKPSLPKLKASSKNIDNLSNFLDLYNYDVEMHINKKAFLKLREPLTKLNEMIGMTSLKQEILDMVIYYLIKLPTNFTDIMEKVFNKASSEDGDSFIEEDFNSEQEEEMKRQIRGMLLSRFSGDQQVSMITFEDDTRLDVLEDDERQVVMGVNENLDMLHTIICGPPGTGKSHVAEIIGEIYSALGFLEPEKPMVTVGASDFISNHIGETSMKTNELLQSALGGVLFFDEAYSISGSSTDKSFSSNAVDTFTSYLTTHKHDFVMIVAGYEDALNERFFGLNKGLRRRFPWKFNVQKYSADELRQIFELMAKKAGYTFPKPLPQSWFQNNYELFPHFGGSMESLLSKVKISQGRRVIFLQPEHQNEIILDDMNSGLEKYKLHGDHDKMSNEKLMYQQLYC